jgi:glycosyltransferase involved in cell wall biosynthesis
MRTPTQKPRLAVVSPFLDKRHGTERRVVEWVSQLANSFEVHIYSQRVEDVDPSKFTWHRIPKLPGPHLANFLWWFVANRLWREWDRRFRGLRHDLIFSPGPNCLDADAISVHIVFAEYVRKLERGSGAAKHTPLAWLRLMHRSLYYRLLIFLERRAYRNPNITLILIANRTSTALREHYGRGGPFPVVYLGLDHETFNPSRRVSLRECARKKLELSENHFVLLLIGNDWRNKGGPVLLEVLAELRDLNIVLLFVTSDDPAPLHAIAAAQALEGRMRILPPRRDVEFYYAAADAYVGPSLEDTFALPPAEAMASGLPTIVSAVNGTSEIITHGVNGMILDDPRNVAGLAALVRRLHDDESFRLRLGRMAAETARRYSWERNGRELTAILEETLRRKSDVAAQTLSQEL